MIDIGKEIKPGKLYHIMLSNPRISKYIFIDLDKKRTELTYNSKNGITKIEKSCGYAEEFSIQEIYFHGKKISSYVSAFVICLMKNYNNIDETKNDFKNQIKSIKSELSDIEYNLILHYCFNLEKEIFVYHGPAS